MRKEDLGQEFLSLRGAWVCCCPPQAPAQEARSGSGSRAALPPREVTPEVSREVMLPGWKPEAEETAGQRVEHVGDSVTGRPRPGCAEKYYTPQGSCSHPGPRKYRLGPRSAAEWLGFRETKALKVV